MGYDRVSLGRESASLLMLAGAVVAVAVMQVAARLFTRVCQQHGTALAACGLTGQLVAERLLARSGLNQVTVARSKRRNLYHPWKKQIQLDTQSFDSPSLHALTAAAHEVGHAQQFAARILVCRLRTIFWPICWTLLGLLVGLPLLQVAGVLTFPITNLGPWLLGLGAAVLLLQLPIELPLEHDASRRARQMLVDEKLIVMAEQPSVDAILRAAWLTHAARLAQGGIYLLLFATLFFLYPTFVGSSEVEAQNPTPEQNVARAAPAGPATAPVPATPLPPWFDELPINPFFSLFSSVLAVVPCLLLYIFLARLAPGGRRNKTPTQLAIERNNAGQVLFEKGALPAAIEEFNEALRLNPRLATAYYNRGQTYFRLGRLDEALADFEGTLQITPNYAYGVAARAQIWSQRGDLDRALAEYDTALKLAPENPTLLSMRGFARLLRSHLDGALADFESALRYNPREALAYRGRATVWMHRAEADKALADLERALELGDRDGLAYTLRGQTWLFKNDYDRAIAELTKGLDLDSPIGGLP
jgi:Zn-dependent membrane protease YugP/Flp pilus assembly protein TadD